MSQPPAEPSELLSVYKEVLAQLGAPPCAPLLGLLEKAAEDDIPIATLNLKEAGLGAEGAKALAPVLLRDSFLTYACLEENELRDEGTALIADALRRHQTVFRLDLGYNRVTGKGVKALAALLVESPSLLCLALSGNNLWSRLSYIAPSSMSALAPLGKALATPSCKLQLLHTGAKIFKMAESTS